MGREYTKQTMLEFEIHFVLNAEETFFDDKGYSEDGMRVKFTKGEV